MQSPFHNAHSNPKGNPHKIRLQPVEYIEQDVIENVASFCSWYHGKHKVRHPITVYLLPANSVRDEEDEDGTNSGYSAIGIPEQSPDLPISEVPVFLAAEFAELVMHDIPETSRQDAVWATVENLAWELVHYERWRDGKPVTIRGATTRSRNLVDKWIKEVSER